ncbi:hypothetical protein HDU67_000490 [Dinochytrium kinnereticum]|nr:hypothetical protein HDU67_000490 [Dinochytrium kinnereticum]
MARAALGNHRSSGSPRTSIAIQDLAGGGTAAAGVGAAAVATAAAGSAPMGAGIISARTTQIKVKIPSSWNLSAPSSPNLRERAPSSQPQPIPSSQSTSAAQNNITAASNSSTMPPLGRSQSPLSISSSSSTSSDRTFAASRVSNGAGKPPKPVGRSDSSGNLQVNDKAVRKIMDLEIANESLLAVNSSLEDTIREQSRKMEQMNKRIAFLSRSVPAMVVRNMRNTPGLMGDSADGGGRLGISDLDDPEERLLMLEGPTPRCLTPEVQADGERESEEDIGSSVDAEITYKRVCAILTQLVDDGTRALARDCVVVSGLDNVQSI